jgi:hypothetical protein
MSRKATKCSSCQFLLSDEFCLKNEVVNKGAHGGSKNGDLPIQMEPTDLQEVRHKASLLSGTSAPSVPSSQYLLHCGIVPEYTSDERGKSSATLHDSFAVRYSQLQDNEVETLVRLWSNKPSQEHNEDSSDDETEVRRCMCEIMLTEDEKSSLLELLSDAPNRAEWWRATNLFWRRSIAHAQAR